MLKTYRVFLASSNELKEDREKFAALITRLNEHYHFQGFKIILDIWEFIDPAHNNKRKQDEYNKYIKNCDVFVVLFYTKAGGYTVEELNVARKECETRQLPLFIYFRDLNYWQVLQKKDENLEAIKKYIGDNMQHFWGSYSTNDKLHLDFVLWLDKKLCGGKSDVKVKNGNVMLDDVIVTKMLQLPFASNNEDFKQMYQASHEFPARIEKLRKRTEKYPDDQEIHDELQEALNEYNALTKKFEGFQQTLLDTAKFIADRQQEQTSEKLQRAIDSFESGDMAGANAILKEVEIEADELDKNFEHNREQLHKYIEFSLLQAKTEMANLSTPIEKRIARVAEIYAKADDRAERSAYNKEKYAKLLFDYGSFLDDYAFYNDAEKIYQHLIDLSEELYGNDSTETAVSYNNIGIVYWKQGKYDKALEFYFKALAIYEEVLGINHPFCASSYNYIGLVYERLGRFDKALEYYFKSMNIREKVLGLIHTSTATSYNNIGFVYFNHGDYDKALEYYLKALAIDENLSGKEHQNTATSYNNIGGVYDEKGDSDKALEYYYKALNVFEKVFGPNHPFTASSYNNIGTVYDSQGDYDKALEFYLNALEIREKVFGIMNRDVAASYNNIGLVYDHKGDYNKALENYFKAMHIDEKVLGQEHLDTVITYNNIGLVYYNYGDYDKALEYYIKVLNIRKKVLGSDHPDIASSYKDICLTYHQLGDYDKALEYYKRAEK